ncbi:MAG: hypothetical protein JSS66_09790 [Armatimonadetes bacterium]|nr:hypothetical protein [Armatimonadota bacterium]
MLATILAAIALTGGHVGHLDEPTRPKPPTDLSSYKVIRNYLNKLEDYEAECKKRGEFDEEEKEFVEEEFEFYGMRAHMLMMRGGEDGIIDQQQYRDAIKHRKEMEPLSDPAYIGTGWTFIGPRALDGTSSVQNGPVTGRVNSVVYDPADSTHWWVGGATGGVFKTADNGASFTGESDTWDTTYCSAIAIDPNNSNRVYVATGDFPGWWGYGLGIMRTSNGTSWTNELTTELQGCEVSDIMVDPDNSSHILCTSGRGTQDPDGAGIWLSTDYGNTWTKMKSSPTGAGFSKLAYSNKVSNVRHIYAAHASNGFAYRSDDGGQTWDTLILPGSGLVSIAASRTNRDVVYAYVSTGDIYMSTDAGDNWTNINGNLGNITAPGADFRQVTYNYMFGVINSQPDGSGTDVLLFGAVDCFALVNPIGGGRTWRWINGVLNQTRQVHADYHGFTQHPTTKSACLIANDGGVWQLLYISSLGLFTWTNMNDALRLTEHVFTAPHPDASNNPNYINTGMWHLGCGWSPNNVNDWRSNYGGDGMWTAIDDTNPAIQFSSSQNLGAGGLIQFSGTNTSWVSKANFTTNTSLSNENWAFAGPWTEIPGDSGALYMAGERLYKFKWTGGTPTWTKSIGGADFSVAGDEYATAITAVSGGGCFVGTQYGRLFGSLTPSLGVPQLHDFVGPISSICASPTDSDDLLVSIGGVENGGPNGNGALWEVLDATSGSPSYVDRSGSGTNSLPGIGVNWVVRDPYDPMFTWYVATDLGVYYTRDRGANWYNISESFGLPNALVYHLAVSDNILYASTFGRGIWRMSLYSSAPTLTAFTFQGTEVTGGASAPATMTLSREAPPGGLDIPVTSNNLNVIKTQLVHFPGGATTATVYVKTEIVTNDVTVTATANYGGPVSDSIIVRECKVIDLQMPASVTAGNGFVGLVLIDRPAPPGGIDIDLVSNDPSGTHVETPVTILSGATGAFFNVDTDLYPVDQVVGVQASGPGSGWQESFTKLGVRATNVIGFVDIMWNTLPGTISVVLNRAAPTGGFTFVVQSGDPNVVQVPGTYTVPAGQSSGTFQVGTKYVPVDTNVGVRLWDPYGQPWDVTMHVQHLGVQSLTFNPNPVVGGNPSTGTVTLDRNVGIVGFTVNLSSQYTNFVQVPPTMTVPANSTSGTFQATTFSSGAVNDIPITALIGSQQVQGAYQTTNLRLLPPIITIEPSSFTINLGKLNSGNVASLANQDNNPLEICKFIVPNQQASPVTVQVDGSSPLLSATTLKLQAIGKMTASGLYGQTLEMWNWTTNNWDATDVRTDTVNTAYATRELVGTGGLSRYFRSSDGAVKARYRVRQTGPGASANWCHNMDRLVWILTP